MLLDSHPLINSQGELFRRMNGLTAEQILADAYPCQNVCEGFKLFYFHPYDDRRREVWDWLEQANDVRIIHLIRDNIVRSHISQTIALRDGVWGSRNGALKKQPIEVDPHRLELIYYTTLQHHQRVRQYAKSHPYFELSYRQLIGDTKGVGRMLLKFLDLPDAPMSSPMTRQNPEPLSELVSNYDELCEVFGDSEIGQALRDDD